MKATFIFIGSAMLKPFKWYIETSAKNYERLFGDNLQYVRWWM